MLSCFALIMSLGFCFILWYKRQREPERGQTVLGMDPAVQTKVILAVCVGGGSMILTALLVLGILMCRRKARERNELRSVPHTLHNQ